MRRKNNPSGPDEPAANADQAGTPSEGAATSAAPSTPESQRAASRKPKPAAAEQSAPNPSPEPPSETSTQSADQPPPPTAAKTTAADAAARLRNFRTGQTIKKYALAAGGVAVAALSIGTPQGGVDYSSINGCGLEGAASANTWQWTANPLKNRFSIPGDGDIDHSVTLDQMLASGDSTQFDQNKGAEIEGYITEVKMGGTESCNCRANDPQFMDTHIYVGQGPDADKQHCIIVEVTPRLRAEMASAGIDWSTPTLISNFSRQHVRISGWLFYDQEHESASVANSPDNARDWRSSCWEIHPVTSLDIVNEGSSTSSSVPGGESTTGTSGSPGSPGFGSGPTGPSDTSTNGQ